MLFVRIDQDILDLGLWELAGLFRVEVIGRCRRRGRRRRLLGAHVGGEAAQDQNDGWQNGFHGGAYAVPINQRPYFMSTPAESPYYAFDITNLPNNSWVSRIQAFFGAPSGEQWASEVFMDANVPHVVSQLDR